MKDECFAIGRFLDIDLYGKVLLDRSADGRRGVLDDAVVGVVVAAMGNRAGEDGIKLGCHGKGLAEERRHRPIRCRDGKS
ncbi:hypothetical protein QW131_06385 [Roseibium salinum]|nr:hypothetical protein [Roseibium salinum]